MKRFLLSLILGINAIQVYSQSVNIGSNATISQGETKELIPVITGGTAPYQYRWNTSNNLSDSTNDTVDVSPMTTCTYILIVTDANSTQFSDTITITVNPVIHAIANSYHQFGSVNLTPTWDTGDPTLDSVLTYYDVYSFKLAHPSTTDTSLGKYYYLKSRGNIDDLINALDSSSLFLTAFESFGFRGISLGKTEVTKVATDPDEPDDYNGFIEVASDKFNTNTLEAINIKEAWSYSKGGVNQYRVAIMNEGGFYPSHPDLFGRVTYNANFGEYGAGAQDIVHGTRVAGLISAATDNGKGISGVGHNTYSVICNKDVLSSDQYFAAVLDAFNNDTVRVVTNSWIGYCEASPSDPDYDKFVNWNIEWGHVFRVLNELGIVNVFGAGNGYQNNGAEGCLLGTDNRAGKCFPGSLPGAISVGGFPSGSINPTTGRYYYSDYVRCQDLGGTTCYGAQLNTFGYQYIILPTFCTTRFVC